MSPDGEPKSSVFVDTHQVVVFFREHTGRRRARLGTLAVLVDALFFLAEQARKSHLGRGCKHRSGSLIGAQENACRWGLQCTRDQGTPRVALTHWLVHKEVADSGRPCGKLVGWEANQEAVSINQPTQHNLSSVDMAVDWNT